LQLVGSRRVRFIIILTYSSLGYDNGLIVFKLERERPPFAVHQDTLYYIRDKYVRVYDFNTGSDIGLLNICKFGSPYVPPRTLSFNPAERAVIATITSDNGLYELASLPAQSQGEVKDSSVDGKKGAGHSAIFVARSRFAVLHKTSQVSISSCFSSISYIFNAHLPGNAIADRSPRPFQFRCQVYQTTCPNK
jgi:hypothetical protein